MVIETHTTAIVIVIGATEATDDGVTDKEAMDAEEAAASRKRLRRRVSLDNRRQNQRRAQRRARHLRRQCDRHRGQAPERMSFRKAKSNRAELRSAPGGL